MSLATPHSAEVVLTLLIGGVQLALSHVGPNEIIVRDPCGPIPSGDAQLYIQVDDSREYRTVFLPHGISGPHVPVTFF